MDLWNELIKTAILGTEQSTISATLVNYFQQYQIDTIQNPNAQLLEAAATFGAMRRAGYVAPEMAFDVIPASALQTNVCSEKSCSHLQILLRRTDEGAIREFLYYLQKNQKVLPPEYLPQLLEQAIKKPTLVSALRPILGVRGMWLAQQNPAWQHIQLVPVEIDWKNATTDKKVQCLMYWRLNDPATGLEILSEHWAVQKPTVKVQLLKTLETSLSLADESFLESCLDGKRKEIRRQAVQLLVGLEGSAYVLRMFERAQTCLSIKISEDKGLKMEVVLPEHLDDAAIRDGLSLDMQWQKKGSAAGILYRILQCVPPYYWQKHFGIEKSALLESMVRSDWALLLLQACVDATTRFEDIKWMEVLLRFVEKNEMRSRWTKLDIAHFVEKLPAALIHKTAIRYLESKVDIFREQGLAVALFETEHHQWDESLAIAFVRYLKQMATQAQQGYWSAMKFRSIIKNGAYRCPPESYEKLNRILPEAQYRWTIWEEDYSRFFSILRFRYEMVQALKQ